MASFEKHLQPLIEKEGGYQLTDTAGDRGGRTYAGISETSNPTWEGWGIIEDDGALDTPRLREAVRQCYLREYWTPIHGYEIMSDMIVEALFSSAVLSGPRTAIRLAQAACGAETDGFMGPNTIRHLNGITAREFLPNLGLARIARFSTIVALNKTQEKFFRGWVNRVLREMKFKV